MNHFIAFLLGLICCAPLGAQVIPSGRVLTVNELSHYFTEEAKEAMERNDEVTVAQLALYFRRAFKTRYFFNWETVDQRFQDYQKRYPTLKAHHAARAATHRSIFPAQAQWKLPYKDLNGEAVNAYALRHLARQHKMVDIGYSYFYNAKERSSIEYFTTQLASLNTAFANGDYEKLEDGNGVYEAFRSGYRILNWLHLHSLFLGEKAYSDEAQLQTIATLLQHAQHLYEHNRTFKFGNHQTRGLSALAMVAILLKDFKGAELWYQHAMTLLGEHLDKEINADGFQFERTIHYHISDIGNYFYVYQLAKKNQLNIEATWENKLKSMFLTLAKIAFPDQSAPVLSDDTDTPWAEKNDISGAMTLGYLLFEDPEMGYFSTSDLSPKFYWNVSASQLLKLENIQKKTPTYTSLAFPDTGYYVMREGWETQDHMLVISAGLDENKPDHQHGDMLGIQAMANGQVVLPNYQVRYSLDDLELFKNSLTKNVALVDNELQGKAYTSNKGGSGFGKFKSLPQPEVTVFKTGPELELFVGRHNGFEAIGVDYSRQVLNVENAFWIVKDNFKSEEAHTYKQIWQGHYSLEKRPNLLRSSFKNGSGLDIYQLHPIDTVSTDGARGKTWAIATKNQRNNCQFITVVFPFKTYDARIDETGTIQELKGWQLNASKWKMTGEQPLSLSKNSQSIFFNIKQLQHGDTTITFNKHSDVWLNDKNELKMMPLHDKEMTVTITQLGTSKTKTYHVETNNMN